jgi:membrane protein insertase Oxa1/YidC/SpoIIIJ
LSHSSKALAYCSFLKYFLKLFTAVASSAFTVVVSIASNSPTGNGVVVSGKMLRRGGVALAGRLLSHGSTKTSAVRSIRFISSTRVNLSGDTVPSDVPDVVTPVIDAVPEIGYYPPDLIARALDGLHVMTGMPYWQAIIVGTVALRVLLLPSSIMGLRASSRIAAVRPEVDQLSKRMEKDPDNKALYEAEIVHIHKKYKVSYISGFGQPLVQLPVFLSTFFALRQMGTYFPEYTSGGTLWFTDLSIADPTFVLPVASAASFLLLTELGSDDVKMQNYPWFKTVMRVMGVGIIPLTYFLPSV